MDCLTIRHPTNDQTGCLYESSVELEPQRFTYMDLGFINNINIPLNLMY